jgi:hypothetical protein
MTQRAQRIGALDVPIPVPTLDMEAMRTHFDLLLRSRVDLGAALTEVSRMAWNAGYVARYREETATMLKGTAPGAVTPEAAEMGGARTPAVSVRE